MALTTIATQQNGGFRGWTMPPLYPHHHHPAPPLPHPPLAAFGQQRCIADKSEVSALMCCSEGFPQHIPSFLSSLKPLPVGSSLAAYTRRSSKRSSHPEHKHTHTHSNPTLDLVHLWLPTAPIASVGIFKLRFTPMAVSGWFVPHFDLVFCRLSGLLAAAESSHSLSRL